LSKVFPLLSEILSNFTIRKKSAVSEDLKLQLFEQKQKFLREIPHPKLILKEMKVLKRINPELDITPLTYGRIEMLTEQRDASLKSFLDRHINDTLQIKHSISLAQSAEVLFEILQGLFISHVRLLKKLQSYLCKFQDGIDEDIKMSVPMDSYAVLKRITELNLKENEIKDYLCKEIKAQEKPLDTIAINCLRANKILSHV
jgi:hypothetical protein